MSKELNGNEIRRARELLGFCKREFARRLNVSATSLWGWEIGRSKPSPLAKEKLERAIYYSKTDKNPPHQF